VNATRAPEDAGLADALDKLGKPDPNNPGETLCPDTVTIADLVAAAAGDTSEWLMDRKNRRAFPHRLERCGYVSVRNPLAQDGLWKINGARQVVYAKANLTPGERLAAARKLAGSPTS